MNPDQVRRKKKLVQPGFQLRLIGKFVGVAALALMLQFLLLGFLLSITAQGLEEGAAQVAQQIPAIILKTMAFSFLVLLPLLAGFGVLLTARIAGPVYRFEGYLRELALGEATGPCRLRDGDELQPLCDAINKVSDQVRLGSDEGQHAAQAHPHLRRVS